MLLGTSIVLPASAYESDVHEGLTEWLAEKAGFSKSESHLIALGNQRVDSGDVRFVRWAAVYACGPAKDRSESDQVRARHFPTGGSGVRVVVPGSAAANAKFEELLIAAPGKASLLLNKLGEALHPIQDSWANQGNADFVPAIDGANCDGQLSWASPALRGGWSSHRAHHTFEWSSDSEAMIRATYGALLRYRAMMVGSNNASAPWNLLQPELATFIDASTKAAKNDWFAAHGVADTGFLAGVTLPDGGKSYGSPWAEGRLPLLESMKSGQAKVDRELRDFFGAFLQSWISSADLRDTAVRFGGPAPGSDARPGHDVRQLLARLRLWRSSDHGAVEELAHAPGPFTKRQIAQIESMKSWRTPFAVEAAASTALIPLLPSGDEVSPLLPFFVLDLSGAGTRKAIAVFKFKNTPYDVLEAHGEKIGSNWRIVSITSSVEH